MKREIAIHEVADDVLITELGYFVDYFRALGHARCRVLFGWHWGMDYYATKTWDWLDFALDDLMFEVQKVQESDIGHIGRDDLHISIPLVESEFCFCHHSGVHLSFDNASAITEHFFNRWESAGLAPIERECTST